MPKRKRNADGTYSAGGRGSRRGSYPYAVATKYRKRAVSRAGVRGSAGSRAYWGDTWDAADEGQRERRALMHYRGDGDYRSALKWGSRGLGAAAGALLGGYGTKSASGALKGGRTGYDLGAGFSKYMGWGAYGPQSGVHGNQLIDPGQMKIAVNADHNSGDIVFQHTEFIQNVVVDLPVGQTVSQFDLQSFPLNPGLEGTFPFLAQIAANFTMYEFEGLIFQYKPTSGEGASESNALGKVILATDYDPSAHEFTNTQAMENYDYASSIKPSGALHHGVETALSQRLTNQLYIRTEDSPPGPSPQGQKDKVLTDLGLFQIATEGIAGPEGQRLVIGELWVTYRVKLSRASLRVNQSLDLANFDRFLFAQGVDAQYSPQLKLDENSLGGTISLRNADKVAPEIGGQQIKSGFIYTMPRTVVAGTYLVTMAWTPMVALSTVKKWDAIYVANGSLVPLKDDSTQEPIAGDGTFIGGTDSGAATRVAGTQPVTPSTPVWTYAVWAAEGYPKPSDKYVHTTYSNIAGTSAEMMQFVIKILAHDASQGGFAIVMDDTHWTNQYSGDLSITQVNDDFALNGSAFIPI